MFGKNIFKHELGNKAKDKITGFEGIIVARTEYLTGCNQYCLTPKADGGDYKDSVYIDEDRIEIIEAKKINKEDVTGPNKGRTGKESEIISIELKEINGAKDYQMRIIEYGIDIRIIKDEFELKQLRNKINEIIGE